VVGLVVATLVLVGAAPVGAAARTEPTGTTGRDTRAFAGVIDAGSSGSRVALYETRGEGRRLRVEALHFYNPNDGGPGIAGLSTFVGAPERAGPDGIAPLLADLDRVLAGRGIATAGMRNVERDAPAATGPIYASVRRTVEDAGYTVGRIGTMPGRDEAVYSWAAVNYLTGALRSGRRTTGIAEVGGASAQVAFETTGRGPDVEVRRIMGTRRRLLAVSYLGLGRNDARATMIAPDASAVGSPCWPNNATGAAPAAYAAGNVRPVAATASLFSWERCSAVALAAIDDTVTRPVNADRIRPTAIRDVAGFTATRFVGIDKLTEAYEEFGIEPGAGVGPELGPRVRAVCPGPDAWSRVRAGFDGDTGSTAQNACANATYVATWLFSPGALRIPPERLAPRFDLAGTTLTWTLGHVILVAS